MRETVSLVVGEPVMPSYSYLVSYESGAALPEHTDRAQCEFTLGLLVDFAPEPAWETPWPLHVRGPMGTVPLYQAIGDALIYRGRALSHYRDAFTCGNTSTSLFLHYVRAGFRGSLD